MPADRPDFGARLRAAREARGLSLKAIAASTKISTLVLEALERNDLSRLPGGLFSRSFVRAYAKEVGLDPEQAVREFEQRFSDGEAGGHEEPIRRRTTTSESVSHGTVRWVGLAITLLLIAAWIGADRYLTRQAPSTSSPSSVARSTGDLSPTPPAAPPMPRPEVPKPAMEQPARATTTAPTVTQPGAPLPQRTTTSPDASQTGVQAPLPGAPAVQQPGAPGPTAPATVAQTPPPDPSLPLQLVLAPRADCWVSISVDGKKQPGRVMKAGEKVHFAASQTIVLIAGDAGALDYTINNAPGRALGAPGEVKTVVINTTNYQTYLASRPPG